jgi:hypothetical protein
MGQHHPVHVLLLLLLRCRAEQHCHTLQRPHTIITMQGRRQHTAVAVGSVGKTAKRHDPK